MYYVSAVIGAGIDDDEFRPAIHDALTDNDIVARYLDLRFAEQYRKAEGIMFIEADVTRRQHDAIVAAGATWIEDDATKARLISAFGAEGTDRVLVNIPDFALEVHKARVRRRRG